MSELDLTAAGAFASDDDLHAREVTLGGEKHMVYVRRLPAMELRRFYEESQSSEIEVRLNAGFRVVAKVIRKENGAPHMTAEAAKKLKAAPMRELMRVFLDVNKLPDEEELGNA